MAGYFGHAAPNSLQIQLFLLHPFLSEACEYILQGLWIQLNAGRARNGFLRYVQIAENVSSHREEWQLFPESNCEPEVTRMTHQLPRRFGPCFNVLDRNRVM